MKGPLALAVVVLVVAAGFARAGGGEKPVEERLAAIEARLDRIEARFAGGGTPSTSGTLVTLTPAQRAALVVVAARLKFYRAGKAADLGGMAALDFYSVLTPEQTVAIQDVEEGLARGTFGVKWGDFRARIARVALDLDHRWITDWKEDWKRSDAPENKPMMDAAWDVAALLEQGKLADLPAAHAAWEKAKGAK